jgi:RNA polymerase sigma-70 factor (ECF subfamily)
MVATITTAAGEDRQISVTGIPPLGTREGSDPRRIAQRLQARDAAALGELYDRYGNVVYATIQRIARDAATSEDLTQEVFLRVWNRVPSFDVDRGNLSTWLLTIARHAAIDFLRSRGGKQSRLNISIDAMDRPLAGSDGERQLELFSDVRMIRSAMSGLSPKHRELLELAYFEGLSQSEMSRKLEVPLGTVKTWVGSALRSLRDNLLTDELRHIRPLARAA